MNKRYSELDAIRGVAALMVVLYHYSTRYGEIYGYPIEPLFSFKLGKYGVQLFFIVSGFVIFLTLDKTQHAADFIVSRFSRLYPAYWFAVILTFSVVYLFTLPGREVEFETALVNLTMLQKWFRAGNVDGVYWTLAVELSFYLIMFLLFVSKQLKRIDQIVVAWLILIIAVEILEVNKIIQIHQAVKLLFLLEYGNLFIAGIMFYKIMHGGKWINYSILLISLVAEFCLHGKSVIIITAYFLLFYLFATNRMRLLAIKPLIYLGTISYSLYLIHQNIGYVIINEMRSLGILNSISVILVPLLVSLLIAALMQKYLEKPSLILVRSKWKESRLRNRLRQMDSG